MVVLKLDVDRSGALPWLARALDDAVDGEVRFDLGSLAAYSCDSSNYRQIPIAVVLLVQLEQSEHLVDTAIQRLPSGRAWLTVQFAGDTFEQADEAAHRLMAELKNGDDPVPTMSYLDDPAREAELIELREAGLGATAHPTARHENWEGWEDCRRIAINTLSWARRPRPT